jgi:hypothetical protein
LLKHPLLILQLQKLSSLPSRKLLALHHYLILGLSQLLLNSTIVAAATHSLHHLSAITQVHSWNEHS